MTQTSVLLFGSSSASHAALPALQDLPKLWNEKMAEYLGCEPASDAEGVLQV